MREKNRIEWEQVFRSRDDFEKWLDHWEQGRLDRNHEAIVEVPEPAESHRKQGKRLMESTPVSRATRSVTDCARRR
jgi:hypothetical protein